MQRHGCPVVKLHPIYQYGLQTAWQMSETGDTIKQEVLPAFPLELKMLGDRFQFNKFLYVVFYVTACSRAAIICKKTVLWNNK